MFLKFAFVFLISSTNGYKSKNNEVYVPSVRFHLCGSYCGPGWCNNQWLNEDKCNTTVLPEYHKLTGYSCADSCCRLHDSCCGQGKKHQKNCNNEIVDCLSKCDPFSTTCTIDYIPILAGEIQLGMDVVKEWCCGSPCENKWKLRDIENWGWGGVENIINWG